MCGAGWEPLPLKGTSGQALQETLAEPEKGGEHNAALLSPRKHRAAAQTMAWSAFWQVL